jgi:hypothetical protein
MGNPTNLAQSWAKADILVTTSGLTGGCDMSSYNATQACTALGQTTYQAVPYTPVPLQVTGLVPLPGAIANLNIPASLVSEARHEVATLRGIPDDDVNVNWSRGEIRAYLFFRLLQIATVTRTLTADEQTAFNSIADDIINEQAAIAREAQFLYQQWSINPCAFTLPPGAGSDPNAYLNEPGTVSYCAPKAGFAILQNPNLPSAAEFTAWAQGTRMAGRIAAWGQQTYALTSPVPSDGTVQATAEYGDVFSGIYEGLAFLTSQHASIATLDASTLTPQQQDVQGVWMDGLSSVATDRAFDSVGTEMEAIVELLEPESEAVGKELAQEIAELAGAERG